MTDILLGNHYISSWIFVSDLEKFYFQCERNGLKIWFEMVMFSLTNLILRKNSAVNNMLFGKLKKKICLIPNKIPIATYKFNWSCGTRQWTICLAFRVPPLPCKLLYKTFICVLFLFFCTICKLNRDSTLPFLEKIE